jgi:hypothetical protein
MWDRYSPADVGSVKRASIHRRIAQNPNILLKLRFYGERSKDLLRRTFVCQNAADIPFTRRVGTGSNQP